MDKPELLPQAAPPNIVRQAMTPLLLRAADAAWLCHVSLRTWRLWDATGKVPQPIRIGRTVFWRKEDLQAWIAAGCPERANWQSPQQ